MQSTFPADIRFPGRLHLIQACTGVVNLTVACEDCLYFWILSTCDYNDQKDKG